MAMIMPGYDTRSAADVAHQYAVEKLQSQELNLRAQAQQQDQAMQAQRMLMQQAQFEAQKLDQERMRDMQERELALKGQEAKLELGMTYDPALKAYRPLAEGDPEWNLYKERQAERSAYRKAQTAALEAQTPEARLAYQEQLAKMQEPYRVAEEQRGEKRQIDAERRLAERQNAMFERKVEMEQKARAEQFLYEMQEAAIRHRLDMVKMQAVARAKGEQAEQSTLWKEAKQAAGEVNTTFDNLQKALTDRETNYKRILDDMTKSAAEAQEAKFQEGKRWYWFDWRSPAPTREQIAATPQFKEALAPFDQQVTLARQMRDAAIMRYNMVLKAGEEKAQPTAGAASEAAAPTLEEMFQGARQAEQKQTGQPPAGEGKTALGGQMPAKTFSYESVMDAWPKKLEKDQKYIAQLAAYVWKNPQRQRQDYLLKNDGVYAMLFNSLSAEGQKQWNAILAEAGVVREERRKAAMLGA